MNGAMTAAARRNLAITVVLVIVVALLWQQVFSMTGVLWWNAPAVEASARPQPPPPLQLRPPDTRWVDLNAYLKTHPRWQQ